MRRKCPLFPRDAKLFHRLFDRGCKSLQVRRSVDASPENERMFFVRKEPEPPKSHGHGLTEPNPPNPASNPPNFRSQTPPTQFQLHLNILPTPPPTPSPH